MKILAPLFLFIATSASAASLRDCPAQDINWDSDGKSPYQEHAYCEGSVPAAVSGTVLKIEALKSQAIGNGVGFATFRCEDGTWVIESDFSGICAD